VFETKSRGELVSGGVVTAVTVGVVMAAMSDGNALVDGLVAGTTALVAFAAWIWLFSTALATDS